MKPVQPYASHPIVARAKAILLQPKAEWPVIDAEPASIGGIMKSYAMPLAAIPAVCSAIGGLVFGYGVPGIVMFRPSILTAISGAVVQYLLSLGTVLLLGLLIDALAPTFGGTKDRVQAFKVAAYASTAGWVAGIFGLVPQLAILGLIGGLYSLYLLYLGLPLLMRVAQDKALPYVAAVILAAIVLTLVIGAIAGPIVRLFTPTPAYAAAAPSGSVEVAGLGTIDLGRAAAGGR